MSKGSERRKPTKEGLKFYSTNKFWANCEFTKKKQQREAKNGT